MNYIAIESSFCLVSGTGFRIEIRGKVSSQIVFEVVRTSLFLLSELLVFPVSQSCVWRVFAVDSEGLRTRF